MIADETNIGSVMDLTVPPALCPRSRIEVGYGVTRNPLCLASKAATVIIILLSGCQHTASVPTEAKVIVSTPCLTRDQIPAQSFLADADLAKLSDYPFVIAIAQDRLRQREWITSVAAILEACVK